MKKITFLTILLTISSIISVYAGEIAIDQTQSLKTTILAAPEGSVIVLTDDAGIYPCAYIDGLLMTASKLTIKAAPGLTTKPTIQFASSSDLANFCMVKGGADLTFEGVILDGNHTIFSMFYVQYTGLANLTFTDCDFINCTSQAGTGGTIITVKKHATLNTWTVPVGSVNVSNCTFIDVGGGIFGASSVSPANFADISFSNCYFKGVANSIVELFSNPLTGKANNYTFDHITLNGRNNRELSVSANTSIKYTNIIFANNTNAAKALFPGDITSQEKLAFYNFSPARDKFIAFIDGVDPKFGVRHIATATEYVNKGSDGKTIGYYGDGQPDVYAALKDVRISNLDIYPSYVSSNGELKVTNSTDGIEYKVLSSTGAVLNSGLIKNGTIQLNNLTNGFYFVKVKDSVAKFIVR